MKRKLIEKGEAKNIISFLAYSGLTLMATVVCLMLIAEASVK